MEDTAKLFAANKDEIMTPILPANENMVAFNNGGPDRKISSGPSEQQNAPQPETSNKEKLDLAERANGVGYALEGQTQGVKFDPTRGSDAVQIGAQAMKLGSELGQQTWKLGGEMLTGLFGGSKAGPERDDTPQIVQRPPPSMGMPSPG